LIEDDLIAQLRQAFPRFRHGLGIGDDAAIVNAPGSLVLTTDMMVEDLDFTAAIPPEYIIEKAVSSNLSDIAAMGGIPMAFLVSLGLPENWRIHFGRMVASLVAVSRRYAVELIGGDLSGAEKLIVSVTAIGRLAVANHPLLRSGAHPGDRIFLSRPIGAAAAGLGLLQSGWSIDASGEVTAPVERSWNYAERELAASMILRHVAPAAEVELAPRLAALPSVTSCIDISDGLSTDLHHLCQASGVGARIEWERVPLFPDLDRLSGQLGINYVEAALNGGEEYSLLFTAAAREAEMSATLGRPVYAIGRITEDREIMLERGGVELPLPSAGFDHFRT
jgi:thiamine-monophosphate kinase